MFTERHADVGPPGRGRGSFVNITRLVELELDPLRCFVSLVLILMLQKIGLIFRYNGRSSKKKKKKDKKETNSTYPEYILIFTPGTEHSLQVFFFFLSFPQP